MAITNSAVNFISSSLAASLSSGGCLGVGDSTTAFASSQTDLQASTNRLRKVFDGGFPTITTNVITLQTTYSTTEANWVWNEWAVFSSSTGGTMINRKVESLGTKTSSASWSLLVTITLTA